MRTVVADRTGQAGHKGSVPIHVVYLATVLLSYAVRGVVPRDERTGEIGVIE